MDEKINSMQVVMQEMLKALQEMLSAKISEVLSQVGNKEASRSSFHRPRAELNYAERSSDGRGSNQVNAPYTRPETYGRKDGGKNYSPAVEL